MSVAETVLCSDDPPRHIMIGYDDYENFYDISCKFINEGLKRNQFCVYAALKDIDNEKQKLSERIKDFDKHIEKGNLEIIDLKTLYVSILENNFNSFQNLLNSINEKIKDRSDKRVRLCGFLTGFFYEKGHFDEHVEKGNLEIIDLKNFYVSILENNFDSFQNLLDSINEKIKDRSDKRVRLCGFLTGFFYEKKHFDECIALEEWWENNNFKGTVLCPYPKSSLETDTFDNSLEKVMALHNNVIIL